MVAGWNWVAAEMGLNPIRTRDFSLLWRAILALSILFVVGSAVVLV